jgi:hypothetical protein
MRLGVEWGMVLSDSIFVFLCIGGMMRPIRNLLLFGPERSNLHDCEYLLS